MPPAELDVLYEDNHLLAVNKPAGLATMGVSPRVESLFTLAKDYLKRKYHKPGNVYLGVVSRLDAAVSGVVLLARTSKAAARLSEGFRERDVQKTYWAIVEGSIDPPEGELHDWLVKDEPRRRMRKCGRQTAGALEARLAYRRITNVPRGALRDSVLEVRLHTGRKHQIRVQLAAHGHPILGDKKYGGGREFAQGIALHARRLVVPHPVGRAPIEITAPLPDYWPEIA